MFYFARLKSDKKTIYIYALCLCVYVPIVNNNLNFDRNIFSAYKYSKCLKCSSILCNCNYGYLWDV